MSSTRQIYFPAFLLMAFVGVFGPKLSLAHGGSHPESIQESESSSPSTDKDNFQADKNNEQGGSRSGRVEDKRSVRATADTNTTKPRQRD